MFGTPMPLWSIDRFTMTSLNALTCLTSGQPNSTREVKTTAAQYAGKSRETRDTAKSPAVRPQALIQITKPLTRKNISTPSQP